MPSEELWPSRDDSLAFANFRRRPHMVRTAAQLLVGSESEWPKPRLPRNTPEGNRTARFVGSPSHDQPVVADRRWSPLGTMVIVWLTRRYCRHHRWKVIFRVRHVTFAGWIGSHGRPASRRHQSRVLQQDRVGPTSMVSNLWSLPTANFVGLANLDRHRCSERDDDLAARLGLTNVAAKSR